MSTFIWSSGFFFFLPLLLDLMIFCLQTKLKSAVQLQDLLDATRMLGPRTRYFTLHKLQYVIHISITCNSISISHQGLIKFWMCGWSGTVGFLLNITFDWTRRWLLHFPIFTWLLFAHFECMLCHFCWQVILWVFWSVYFYYFKGFEITIAVYIM